jgi:pyrroline-5-carboxylate reductase
MKKIVFFGAGNIAQSIILGLISSGHDKENILFIDRNRKNQNVLKKLGIKEYTSNHKDEIDLFFLAVKPKDALVAYKEICNSHKKPKVISLVAGVRSKKYFSKSANVELIRAMPTTSSRFNKGITASLNISSTLSTYNKAKKMFNKVGMVIELKKEQEMDTFTGLIGSGPAYFFYLLKAYEKRLIKLCNNDSALTAKAMSGLLEGVALSLEDGSSIDDLIKKVASKKGTTEAGLKSFKKNKLLSSFDKGISAAVNRSKEIANES